jgi:hypothetical protein
MLQRSTVDSLLSAANVTIPAQGSVVINNTSDIKTYFIQTIGAFLTVIIMSFLKMFFPKVFGANTNSSTTN